VLGDTLRTPGPRGIRVVHLRHLRTRSTAFFSADDFVHQTVDAVAMFVPRVMPGLAAPSSPDKA